MKSLSQSPFAVSIASRAGLGRIIAIVAVAGFISACEREGAPTAPSASPDFVTFSPLFVSLPQVVPVTSVPQSRAYPGTKVKGEVAVCKDASSPAGTYTFKARYEKGRNDPLARSFTLSPGECSIIYNRTNRPSGNDPVTYINIEEMIPFGAAYALDHVDANDDVLNFRTVTGPKVTVIANAHHGAYVNFVNVDIDPEAPPVTPLVNLGTLANAGILAGTTVTCVSGGFVGGDVSVSPGTAITGFGPCARTGALRSNDGVAQQQQLDLTSAYNALAGMTCPAPNVITADLGGTTLTPGVYCSASSIGVTGVLTLDALGDPNATFVFQAGSTLTTAGSVVLINGAQARNVYWQVGSSATLGAGSHWQGSIFAQTSITIVAQATLVGRALARDGAVTLGVDNVITLP